MKKVYGGIKEIIYSKDNFKAIVEGTNGLLYLFHKSTWLDGLSPVRTQSLKFIVDDDHNIVEVSDLCGTMLRDY